MAAIPDIRELHARLVEADEQRDQDPAALAEVAWELYGLLDPAWAALSALRARLRGAAGPSRAASTPR